MCYMTLEKYICGQKKAEVIAPFRKESWLTFLADNEIGSSYKNSLAESSIRKGEVVLYYNVHIFGGDRTEHQMRLAEPSREGIPQLE